MFHRLLIGLVCLMAIVGIAPAQSGKNKTTRVTYPVADLVVPIADHSFRNMDKPRTDPALIRDALVERLKETITQSVAPKSWESAGGRGNIQYFPAGMAFVIEQRADVHEQIAKLLEDLRHLQDVQISTEVRFVLCSERGAKAIGQIIDKHGQGVRVHKAESSLEKDSAARLLRSLDAKQLRAILEEAQNDRSAHIMQAPKITAFNGQKVALSGGMLNAKRELRDGFLCDLQSVVDPQSKAVRLSLDLEFASAFTARIRPNVKASATVTVAPERTLVWHLGEANGRHLFALVTPRMVVVSEEQQVLAGEAKVVPPPTANVWGRAEPAKPAPRGEAEEQAVPDQKKPVSKEKEIEHRLRQPISLNFKDVPLRQAIKDLSLLTGITVAPDMNALRDAKVDLDIPLSIAVDNIDLKYALKLLLNPLGLRYSIENECLMITTHDKGGRMIRQTYPIVGDLADAVQAVEDGVKITEGTKKACPPVDGAKAKAERGKKFGADIVEIVQNTVAKGSWECAGGNGTIQYLPREKSLVITQTQEIHEEVALLLATLRRLYDLSVELEVRVVQMPADAAKRWQNAMTERDDPLLAAMRLLESGDRVTSITQPRLKVLNGQRAVVETGDQASGCKFDVHPVVTPDRRSVRLTMSLEYRTKDEGRAVEHAMKGSKCFETPHNQTQIWDVGATAGGQHLFVLITPRVIDRSQQEERLFLGEIEPIPGR